MSPVCIFVCIFVCHTIFGDGADPAAGAKTRATKWSEVLVT